VAPLKYSFLAFFATMLESVLGGACFVVNLYFVSLKVLQNISTFLSLNFVDLLSLLIHETLEGLS